MVHVSESRMPRSLLKIIEEKWKSSRIGFLAHTSHPHSDKIRLTKLAQHKMTREGLKLGEYLGGQNREVLAQNDLRYIPIVIQGRGRRPKMIGGIVTFMQARTILKKNGFNPNKTDIHDLEGKVFLHRNGVWIAVDLEQSEQ